MYDNALIARMSKFAADTTNDKLSVVVSRVVNRLIHKEMLEQTPLTEVELRIINLFKVESKN